jgi:ATP-binding cassette subfamily B (MDR/TAP) protein 1
LLAKFAIAGYTKTAASYNKSAGFAEQAISAIRVVTAFGFEKQEIKNYSKHLDQVFVAGVR